MPHVSATFFAFGTLCVLAGMLWGMEMGATENFAVAPAHAHLNLLCWVTMALYGTFYALTSKTMSPGLAWVNFLFSAAGGLVLIPTLAIYLAKGDKVMIPFMIASEVLTVLGLVVFAISVLRELFRARA
jgi:FtsH-binding integral membrane protein